MCLFEFIVNIHSFRVYLVQQSNGAFQTEASRQLASSQQPALIGCCQCCVHRNIYCPCTVHVVYVGTSNT